MFTKNVKIVSEIRVDELRGDGSEAGVRKIEYIGPV
jgi:hypothetical protein